MKFSEIMNEVVQHLSSKPHQNVEIRVGIEATDEEGYDEVTLRNVRENANALNLKDAEFTEE